LRNSEERNENERKKRLREVTQPEEFNVGK